MPVFTRSNKAQYQGNGIATAFPMPFAVYDKAHVHIYMDGAEVGTGFDVVLDGPPAWYATVTFSLPPAPGQKITLARILPLVQEMDLENGGLFNADEIERAFDEAEMQIQQLAEGLERAVLFPISHDGEVPHAAGYLQEMDNRIAEAQSAADKAEAKANTSEAEANRARAEADRAKTAVENSLQAISASAESIPCNQEAGAEFSDGKLHFRIPKGEPGLTGLAGALFLTAADLAAYHTSNGTYPDLAGQRVLVTGAVHAVQYDFLPDGTPVTVGNHAASSVEPAPDTLALRDAGGRLKTVTPAAINDAVSKQYADALGTAAATPDTVMRRDAAGRAQVAAPSNPADIARKDYVDGKAGYSGAFPSGSSITISNGWTATSDGWVYVWGHCTGSGADQQLEMTVGAISWQTSAVHTATSLKLTAPIAKNQKVSLYTWNNAVLDGAKFIYAKGAV